MSWWGRSQSRALNGSEKVLESAGRQVEPGGRVGKGRRRENVEDAAVQPHHYSHK